MSANPLHFLWPGPGTESVGREGPKRQGLSWRRPRPPRPLRQTILADLSLIARPDGSHHLARWQRRGLGRQRTKQPGAAPGSAPFGHATGPVQATTASPGARARALGPSAPSVRQSPYRHLEMAQASERLCDSCVAAKAVPQAQVPGESPGVHFHTTWAGGNPGAEAAKAPARGGAQDGQHDQAWDFHLMHDSSPLNIARK